jgi:hypothetical protein
MKEENIDPPEDAKRGELAANAGKMDYWMAAIDCLDPVKRDAAWRFFHERELNNAKGATDTFSGLLMLMEANGLFMDGCARRVSELAAQLRQPNGGDRLLEQDIQADQINEALGATKAYLEGWQRDLRAQFANVGAAAKILAAQAAQAAQPAAEPKVRPSATSGAAPWIFAIILAVLLGGTATYFTTEHVKRVAEANVKSEVLKIKTWLDVEEQAMAILMAKKGTMDFDLVEDPELNEKVYQFTVKGPRIRKAKITEDGAAVIAFAAQP